MNLPTSIVWSKRAITKALALSAVIPSLGFLPKIGHSQAPAQLSTAESEKQEWMAAVLGEKAFGLPSVLSKFSDGIFYLRAPVLWTPQSNALGLPAITVPEGFVTDLASIPRLFWSVMPRDGKYADAAIVHDYLYWYQTTSKATADTVLEHAMKDLEVSPLVVAAIYVGVRSKFGDIAWTNNQALRRFGELRVLKKYPTSPTIAWSQWKTVRENFL